MFQEESAILRGNVSCVNFHQYNQTYLYLGLNGYGNNDAWRCGLLAVMRTVCVEDYALYALFAG